MYVYMLGNLSPQFVNWFSTLGKAMVAADNEDGRVEILAPLIGAMRNKYTTCASRQSLNH